MQIFDKSTSYYIFVHFFFFLSDIFVHFDVCILYKFH